MTLLYRYIALLHFTTTKLYSTTTIHYYTNLHTAINVPYNALAVYDNTSLYQTTQFTTLPLRFITIRHLYKTLIHITNTPLLFTQRYQCGTSLHNTEQRVTTHHPCMAQLNYTLTQRHLNITLLYCT